MTFMIESIDNGPSRRRILAVNLFQWNVRLGFAIGPRDMRDIGRARQRIRPPCPSPRLREDLGLPPVADEFQDGVALKWKHIRW